MDCDITLKNFRCFPDTNPVRLQMRKRDLNNPTDIVGLVTMIQ